METTPNYIKSLLMPNGRKPTGRKVWSIDLELVWLPFFTATNVMGDTALPHDALGAPLRLAYAADGSVKFSKSGRPVTKVAKELADSVRLVRENFTANLVNYAGTVIAERAEEYRNHVELAQQAGKPIIDHDKAELEKAIAQAEAVPAVAVPPEAEAVPPEAEAEGQGKGKKTKERELVTA